MNKIEVELQKATGKKQGELERQTFLKRLAAAANNLEQDEFDALSKEAREWVNKALDQRDAEKEISDFEGSAEATEDDAGKAKEDDAETEEDEDAATDIDEDSGKDRLEEDEDDEDAEEPKKKKKTAKGKTMAKAKKAARTPKAAKAAKAEKPVKAKKAARGNGSVPNSTLIMRAAIKYPQKNPEELYDYLKKNGYKGTSGGVTTMKTYMSRAVRFLADEGYLNKEGQGLVPKKRGGHAEAED